MGRILGVEYTFKDMQSVADKITDSHVGIQLPPQYKTMNRVLGWKSNLGVVAEQCSAKGIEIVPLEEENTTFEMNAFYLVDLILNGHANWERVNAEANTPGQEELMRILASGKGGLDWALANAAYKGIIAQKALALQPECKTQDELNARRQVVVDEAKAKMISQMRGYELETLVVSIQYAHELHKEIGFELVEFLGPL